MKKELIGYDHSGEFLRLESLTPVYKEELQERKWYKATEEDNEAMFYAQKVDGNKVYGYGFDVYGRYCDTSEGVNSYWKPDLDLIRLATNKEVEETLIKEAKKRGFKEGVRFKLIAGNVGQINNHKIIKPRFYYSANDLSITSNDCQYTIFKDGKWAEIINTNEIKLNEDYTAEIKDGYVLVGCQKIEFKAIKKLYKAIKKQDNAKRDQ